ncbi:butyrophilin subfamily 1 member A1-like [Sorex fumeus]|uniref:butyrophilin subfamily 1 member A1-like n=1 Tax=Sorex fumeus TaxID=62283 RepID=UPI0024AE236F|nr:butyrophilin subfamily 1 member A1-like [Sorex fumeus]
MQPFKEKGPLEQHEELKSDRPSPLCQKHMIIGLPCLSHPRNQQVSPIYRGSIFLFYFCLQIQVLVAGAFQVQGPSEPVVAILGGVAELPCSLSPPQSARNMQIRWSRSLTSQVVHLYKNGMDQPQETLEEYKGRIKLVKNVINKGIVVLRINNVRPSDNGQYYCRFQKNSLDNHAVIELKVAVLGSDPHFSIAVAKLSHIQLECKAENWFPQPKMQLMDSHGMIIQNVSESQNQDQRGLFHATISLLVTETLQETMTCSVWNPVLNQEKKRQLSVSVSELSSSSSSVTERALWGTSVGILLIIIIIGICLYFKKTRKDSHQRCSTTEDN